MRVAIPPLPQCTFMAFCLVKHRHKFTFTFMYIYIYIYLFIYTCWATGWMIGALGFDSWRGLGIFLFTTASRMALGPTQPPIQWVPGAPSLGVKRPGREADHSSPSSAEIKEWVELYFHFPNTPSWRGAQLKKHRDSFTFLPLGPNQSSLQWIREALSTAPRILNLGTVWRWVVSFMQGRFTPRKRGWVGPRVGLDVVPFLAPTGNRTQVVETVA
jgi:hypothetical protein